jgi:monothiol glutaredoxin
MRRDARARRRRGTDRAVGRRDYSSWPTFPQLYIGGEFFGGCDITIDAYKDGSLKEELERAMLE